MRFWQRINFAKTQFFKVGADSESYESYALLATVDCEQRTVTHNESAIYEKPDLGGRVIDAGPSRHQERSVLPGSLGEHVLMTVCELTQPKPQTGSKKPGKKAR
ncbi:hypothetical protein IGB42_03861 [Andreprevotia sp. IGB-42]|nr:hypothetical protein IGB42_03861 [Andreprevotia sp. IGB-42]